MQTPLNAVPARPFAADTPNYDGGLINRNDTEVPTPPSDEKVVDLSELVPEDSKEALANDEPIVEDTMEATLTELRAKLAELEAAKPPVAIEFAPAAEIGASFKTPEPVEADVVVEKFPPLPKQIPVPRAAPQAECSVQFEANPSDAMARYRSSITDMLATLHTIAGATARPSDELSAIARVAYLRHSNAAN